MYLCVCICIYIHVFMCVYICVCVFHYVLAMSLCVQVLFTPWLVYMSDRPIARLDNKIHNLIKIRENSCAYHASNRHNKQTSSQNGL